MPHPKGLVATGFGPATPSYGEPTGFPLLGTPAGPTHPGARRDPAALIAPVQRVTEPPAGLDPPPEPWTPGPATAARRWPLRVMIALGVVMLLGAVGAVLVARQQAGGDADGQLIRASGLSYRVPTDWTPGPGRPETSTNGVALDGVATSARYSCGGHARVRATVGAAFLVRRDGVDARTEDAARDFGPLFAKSFYGAGSAATGSAPTPITVGSLSGSASLVTVRSSATDGCPGLRGQIRVLALPSSRVGEAGGRGVLMLVVQHDAEGGGPGAPVPVTDRMVTEILGSVEVTEVAGR